MDNKTALNSSSHSGRTPLYTLKNQLASTVAFIKPVNLLSDEEVILLTHLDLDLDTITQGSIFMIRCKLSLASLHCTLTICTFNSQSIAIVRKPVLKA